MICLGCFCIHNIDKNYKVMVPFLIPKSTNWSLINPTPKNYKFTLKNESYYFILQTQEYEASLNTSPFINSAFQLKEAILISHDNANGNMNKANESLKR